MGNRMVRIVPLLLITLFAFGLRFWGIDNQLPYGQLPDETGDIATALQIASGDMPIYAYHRVAWSITQIPAYGVYFLVLNITQPGFTLSDFEELYFVERDNFILIARLLSATFASLCVIPIYLLGRHLTQSVRGGYLAAFLIAVQPSHVYLSHLGLPDAFASFWVAIALLGAVIIADTGKRVGYLIAGGAAALVLLARLQAITILLPIALAHIWASYRQPGTLLIRWLWALVAFALVSILFNPFIVLAPEQVITDIQFIFSERFTGTYYNVANAQTSLQNSLGNVLSNIPLPVTHIRPYLILIALLAVVLVIRLRSKPGLIITSFFVVFTISLLPSPGPRITYWLPSIIPAVVLASFALEWGLSRTHRGVRVVALVGTLAVVTAGLVESVALNRILANADTKLLAYDFITNNLPPETRILIGDTFIYSVPLARTAESIERLGENLPRSYQYFLVHPDHSPQPRYDVYGTEYQTVIRNDSAWWNFVEEHAIEYVIEADYCGGPMRYNSDSALEFPVITSEVRQQLELVWSVSPFTTSECQQVIAQRTNLENLNLGGWERTGPIIRIYSVPERQARKIMAVYH